jgi:predicted membrane-bound spermidine synthase
VKQKVSPALESPRALEPALPSALRRYLYFTAAVTGGAIMVVEILGAKMLSPYIGMSHFVWTAQIAVTLVALACGYYAGGRLADRTTQLSRLYWAIFAAAAYLVVAVLACAPVAYWALDFKLALGSLLASTILFFLPLALLAMTGPFLIRVLTSSLAGVGGNVGRLTSISTFGSLLGTLLIGYFLIPLLPNSLTMYFTAGALALVAGGYLLVFSRKSAVPAAIALALAGLAWVPVQKASSPRFNWIQELFSGNSHFGLLQVLDRPDGSCRFYLNDYLVQDTYDPRTKQSESMFTYMLSGLARAYRTNIQDVLVIGLGVGIVPMDFSHEGVRVDVVEINPAVPEVAGKFFDFQKEKVNIVIDDARHYLNRCKKQYDVVVLDAFLGDSSPSHLFSREAFAAMHRVMRRQGVLVINSFGNLREGRDFFTGSLNKTLRAVFTGVRVFTSGDGAYFFAASDRQNMEFIRPPTFEWVHPEVRRETQSCFSGVVDPPAESGRVLTDDYNPTEYYDAPNREDFRRRMAMAVKSM